MATANRWFGMVGAMVIFSGGCFCGAGWGQTEASLYVSDSVSGRPIANVQFTENGERLSARCNEPDATDPSLCTSELLVFDGAGTHSIVVAAAGYQAQTVTVDTSKSDSAHLAVELVALH